MNKLEVIVSVFATFCLGLGLWATIWIITTQPIFLGLLSSFVWVCLCKDVFDGIETIRKNC